MSYQLLGHDGQIITEFHYDHTGDQVTINRVQDVEAILDANKRCFNEGYDSRRDIRRIASIPNVVYEDLWRRGILQDEVRFRRWLNDPDNRHFRTSPGRV